MCEARSFPKSLFSFTVLAGLAVLARFSAASAWEDSEGMSVVTALAEQLDGKELVLALDAPPLVPACWACTACQQGNSHVMLHINEEFDIFGIGHSCTYGFDHDCEDHDLCLLPEEEELGKLWRALEIFDGEQLRAVVAAYPNIVVFNAERSALQIVACDGIIGHIPLSGDRLRVFSIEAR